MSDGPHRSLKMRPGWKKVAEFADMRAFDPEEVSSALEAAYWADWRAGVPDSLLHSIREILGGRQVSLFRGQKVMQLEALRRMAAGHGFGQVLLDCAIQQVIAGKPAPDAPVEATMQALSIWGIRHAREIEEHYCRESTERRAVNLRARVEEAINSACRHELARRLLNLDVAPTPRTSPNVAHALHDALDFLTGDRWQITFRRRRRAESQPRQGLFNLSNDVAAVIPFSDGLDSRAVAGITAVELGDRLVCVRLGSKNFHGHTHWRHQQNRHASVEHKKRQCGICAACMLRRMSVHAAGLDEPPATYVWEDLKAPSFEAGVAPTFDRKKITRAMREHAIAGALHLDHLAAMRHSPANAQTIILSALQLSRACGLRVADIRARLDRMLGQHEKEWKNYVGSLGPESFVSSWIGRVL